MLRGNESLNTVIGSASSFDRRTEFCARESYRLRPIAMTSGQRLDPGLGSLGVLGLFDYQFWSSNGDDRA